MPTLVQDVVILNNINAMRQAVIDITNWLVAQNVGFSIANVYDRGGTPVVGVHYKVTLAHNGNTDKYISFTVYWASSSSMSIYYGYETDPLSIANPVVNWGTIYSYNSSVPSTAYKMAMLYTPGGGSILLQFNTNLAQAVYPIATSPYWFAIMKTKKADGSAGELLFGKGASKGNVVTAFDPVYPATPGNRALHHPLYTMYNSIANSQIYMFNMLVKYSADPKSTEYEFCEDLFSVAGYNLIAGNYYTIDGKDHYLLADNIMMKIA